jgi:hypothetical protein
MPVTRVLSFFFPLIVWLAARQDRHASHHRDRDVVVRKRLDSLLQAHD